MADPGDKAIPYSKMTPEQKRALETTARANARQNAMAGKEPSSFEGALKELKDKLPKPHLGGGMSLLEAAKFATKKAVTAESMPEFSARVKLEERKRVALEEEARKKRHRVSVQELLLRNMEMFSSAHKSVKYKRLTRLHTKTPATILNKVYHKKVIKPFFDIKPHEVAALVPKIKLYLVHESEGPEKKTTKIPLKFRDKTSQISISDITNTKYGRGDGVGIKSFSVETQGTNPAEGGLVKCTLNVFFQNIEMLAHQSKSPTIPSSYDYIELILRRTKYPKKVKDSKGKVVPHARIRNRYGFRLMAVVGWQVPSGGNHKFRPGLIKALRAAKQTIYLNLTNHTLDFRQDGTAMLTCEYQGAIEQILSSDHYDVLAVSETNTLVKQIDKLQKKVDDLTKKGADLKEEGDSPKELKALQKEVVALKQKKNKINKELRTQRYAQILNRLYISHPPRIGTVDLSDEQVEAIKLGKPLTGAGAILTEDDLTPKDPKDTAKVKESHSKRGEKMGTTRKFRADDKDVPWFKDLFTPKPPETYRASFIYFGDLIDIATEVIDKNHLLDKGSSPDTRILLGPVAYYHKTPTGTFQRKQVNLAYVPVSLKSFEYWFNKNVAKTKRDSWSLRSFLKSAVSELVLNALGEHNPPDEGMRRNNMVGIHSFLVRTKGGVPAIQGSDYDLDASTFILGDAEKDKMKDMTPYILVYGSIESPDNRIPNWKKDFEDGIYHFNIGSDHGLLKTATFQKTDVQGMREARFTTQDAEEAQLRDKYDVSIDLIGSSFLFTPGQKIYVNPTLTGLGNIRSLTSTARMLGLGGYYDVIKVLSTYDRDRGYVTNLSAVWTSFGKPSKSSGETEDVALTSTPSDPKKKTPSIASPSAVMGPPDLRTAPTSPPKATPSASTTDVAEEMTKKEEKERVEKAAKAAEERPTPTATREELPPTPRPATEVEVATQRRELERRVATAQNIVDLSEGSTAKPNQAALQAAKSRLEKFNRDAQAGSVQATVLGDGTVMVE